MKSDWVTSSVFVFFQEVNKSAGTAVTSCSTDTPSSSCAQSESSGPLLPAATCWSVSNGTLVKTATSAAGVVQLPGGFTIVPGVFEPESPFILSF